MTHVTGIPLMDVTRARDGQIRICRHMRHYMPEPLSTARQTLTTDGLPFGSSDGYLQDGTEVCSH
jgi:hypothetical protein